MVIMTSVFLVITLSLLLFPPSSSLCQLHTPSPNCPRDLLFEEKTRLGSTPPSCHNKCNGCHPCMAVQVPTLPSHDGTQPDSSGSAVSNPKQFIDPSGNRYSNYKPLGWKCRCGDHFYNP
ncbi:hypothetical protein SLE2022_297460 [Rubroshorea leprosula]